MTDVNSNDWTVSPTISNEDAKLPDRFRFGSSGAGCQPIRIDSSMSSPNGTDM